MAKWQTIANDSKNGNVKDEVKVKDKDKDKVYSLPSKDGMRAILPAAFHETRRKTPSERS